MLITGFSRNQKKEPLKEPSDLKAKSYKLQRCEHIIGCRNFNISMEIWSLFWVHICDAPKLYKQSNIPFGKLR